MKVKTNSKKLKSSSFAQVISLCAEKKQDYNLNKTVVKDSVGVFKFIQDLFKKTELSNVVEQFGVIYLNRSNTIIGTSIVATGGVCQTIVDVKVIFTQALLCSATGIILWHNHPSGNLKASDADKLLTTKITEGAKILDMSVLDHIIIGTSVIEDDNNSFLSFADEGILN